jgi:hypothetical protein
MVAASFGLMVRFIQQADGSRSAAPAALSIFAAETNWFGFQADGVSFSIERRAVFRNL